MQEEDKGFIYTQEGAAIHRQKIRKMLDDELERRSDIFSALDRQLRASTLPDLSQKSPDERICIIKDRFVSAIKECSSQGISGSFYKFYPLIDKYLIIPLANEIADEEMCLRLIYDVCIRYGQKSQVKKRLINLFKMTRYNVSFNLRDVNPYSLDSEDNLIIDESSFGKYFKDAGLVNDGKYLWQPNQGKYEKIDNKAIGQQLLSILKPQFREKKRIESILWVINNMCYIPSFDPNDKKNNIVKDLADPVQFIEELFDYSDESGYPVTPLYELYQQYCELHLTRPYSHRDFMNTIMSIPELSKRSFNRDNCRCVAGIGLSENKMRDFQVNGLVFPSYSISYYANLNRIKNKRTKKNQAN